MYKAYIGIDNGISGSIGIRYNIQSYFINTPVFSSLDYTKKKRNRTRIDTKKLYNFLNNIITPTSTLALIERPMVNPARFQASASALRALEATLIVIENLKIPYEYIDSKAWQKEMLPSGIKGAANLKKASLDIGKRLFPQFTTDFKDDADGILIAEWAKRNNL